ncbi:MAG: hypothetical protein HUK16_10130, partial [Bacteroidales bacterium]|nr:hypothetical protein [Bacteroidales bacterium]
TNYLNIMYSPDPRNVKITYQGGGVSGASAVAVSANAGETQHTFIYYKTIEKTQIGETGNYAYHVIPNPFSKRPATGTTNKTYYGFGGWKIISGGEYISEYSNGQTMPLEATIHFTNLDNGYTPNCTSAEIVLEATWTQATVRTSAPGTNDFNSGTYETNFWVIGSNDVTLTDLNKNMTITDRYPDGSAQQNSHTTTKAISVKSDFAGTVKLEYMTNSSGTTIQANGRNLFIGRGVDLTSKPFFLAANGGTVDQVVRIESGTISSRNGSGDNTDDAFRLYGDTAPTNLVGQVVILGCDYDRANGDNDKLVIPGDFKFSNSQNITSDYSKLTTRVFVKSGSFQQPIGNLTANQIGGENTIFYMGCFNGKPKDKQGRRYLEIQGGKLWNIAAGSTTESNSSHYSTIAFALRMKGGHVGNVMFGCARSNDSQGSRAFVVTGGRIDGWISPGTNGTKANGGMLQGYGYLYFGGNASIDSKKHVKGSEQVLMHSVGGNLFGAGCGISVSDENSGGNSLGTNTVVADNAYVQRGVYGGGSFGFTNSTAYIYITGGHVDAEKGGVPRTNITGYDGNITNGVFGGSCNNRGQESKIYMTGGTVDGGIYGGSNLYGTMSGNTNIKMVGGKVNGSVFGGGLGS